MELVKIRNTKVPGKCLNRNGYNAVALEASFQRGARDWHTHLAFATYLEVIASYRSGLSAEMDMSKAPLRAGGISNVRLYGP